MDKRERFKRAMAAIDGHRPDDALTHLWDLVDRPHLADDEFGRYLVAMARAYSMRGQPRATSTIFLYLGQLDTAWNVSEDPRDRARVRVAQGRAMEAARLYTEAGWLGHAAIQLEDADQTREARVLWERLSDDPRLASDPYTHGLVCFNLGRACRALEDNEAARRATVRSMHLLEAAADGFEALGQRERAFDCYQVLLTLGKEGAFENLAEGYLGCIRILQEDNLKYYVLQYYEDFQQLALQRGEYHAAATLFREAADFCRRHRLPYERAYRERAAETQVQAAAQLIEQGTPEMAENAYAAAIDLFNDLGAYSRIREVYGALSALELGEKRQARYARLRKRLADEADDLTVAVPFPDYLRMSTAYPEIWRLDVIEWEQDGDAAETMGEVLLDKKWPDFTRRRALLCRLHQLGAGVNAASGDSLAGLAQRLGRVEIYAALAPLEKLVLHEDVDVRAAVLESARQLFFKRTFVLVMKGLADEAPAVRRQALEAVRQLHFGHAFDPLQRIFVHSSDADVRSAALNSIGRIPTIEAAEMLIDTLRQGTKEEQGLAKGLLIRAEHVEVDNLLKRTIAAEAGATKEALSAVLSARRG